MKKNTFITIYSVFLIGLFLLIFSNKVFQDNGVLKPETEKTNLRVLLYSKTAAYRHDDAISSAKKVFDILAKKHRWKLTISDLSSNFNSDQLLNYDVVIWNNVTGKTLTETQQKDFRNYLEQGGGYVGIHGAGDDTHEWEWYYDQVIRAVFSHHSVDPQFQKGILKRECPMGSLNCRSLPEYWEREEEWYVFFESPRVKGAKILYTLEEEGLEMTGWETYHDFGMGDDHPIVWYNCVGAGKAFYSALGHKGSYFEDPSHQNLLIQAIKWAGNKTLKCK